MVLRERPVRCEVQGEVTQARADLAELTAPEASLLLRRLLKHLYSVPAPAPLTMFSGSNSYLGGANSGRPGQQQYGQSSFQGQPSPFGAQQQQQPGFGQGGLQPQYTGYPQPGGLQPQATGFPGQQPQQQFPQPTGFQQPQQPGFQQPQPTGFQQPQPTGFQQPQPTAFQQPQPTGFQRPQPPPQAFQTGQDSNGIPPPPQVQRPQPTGMTSSDVANSFRSSAPVPSAPAPAAPRSTKIPNIRLSFITAQDQSKFEQLFKSAVGDGQALSGEKAKDLLLRSKLDGNSLGNIW